MMYDKKSIIYQINLEALHEMEECVPMMLDERKNLREWARKRSRHRFQSMELHRF